MHLNIGDYVLLTLMSRALNIIIRFIINKLAFQLTFFCFGLVIQGSYKSGKKNRVFNLSFVIVRPEGHESEALKPAKFSFHSSVFSFYLFLD